jgi:hypothetical protein
MVIRAAKTPEAALSALTTMARKAGAEQAYDFEITFLVTTWTAAAYVPDGVYHLADVPGMPRALVRVLPDGRVVCSGPRNLAEVNRVYEMFH